MNFTLGGILMFSAFAVLLIIMAVTVSRAAGFSKKNVNLPRISAPAKVVSKRTFSMSKEGKAYFMTFEFKRGTGRNIACRTMPIFILPRATRAR